MALPDSIDRRYPSKWRHIDIITSCITIPALSRVEAVELLQDEGLAGSGAATLGRYSNGDIGIVRKVLASLELQSGKESGVTRTDIERTLIALGLHPCRFSEEEWRMIFEMEFSADGDNHRKAERPSG